MATATLTQQTAQQSTEQGTLTAVDALLAHGELYRNAEGHDVWRIRDLDGSIYADDIASDFDAQWLADQMLRAN